MEDELSALQKALKREREARKSAETFLEQKSLELYQANELLKRYNDRLTSDVAIALQDVLERERRLSFAIEEVGDGMWEFNLDTLQIIFSPRYKELLGYSIEEFIDTTAFWSEHVHPDDLNEITTIYKEYIAGNRSTHSITYRLQHRNGAYIWVMDNGKILISRNGKSRVIIGINTDINIQKESEASIQYAANRIANLIHNFQSGMIVENEFRKIELANKVFCNIFGISVDPSLLKGGDCVEASQQAKLLFKDPEGFIARIEQILIDQKNVSGDLLEMNDGRILSRDYIPFFTDNSYRGHLWHYTDITESKRYQDRLQKQEEKYRGIIENMNLGLMEVDNNGQIQYVNQSFCTISGYHQSELINMNANSVFVAGENLDEVKKRSFYRKSGISDAYELKVKNKRGELRWWLISGAPKYDANGNINGSIGIHLDFTEQKEIEVQLIEAKTIAEASSKAKEKFMANMSHEIRTPINAIYGLGKQLLKTSLDVQQKTFVEAMNTASNNLLVIINDILDVSKIEAGKLAIERISFSLNHVINHTLNILIYKAEEKGITLESHIDPEINDILIGDPFRLGQIFLNLIGNSIKFTEKGGIKIFAKLSQNKHINQEIEFIIKDTGIGMSNEFLDHLFDKFIQEDDSTARTYGGTGLGLNISRELIELMGGSVVVKSKKNKGTTFSFKIIFPKGVKAEVKEKKIEQVKDDCLINKKIILAEDNIFNRLLATTILERYGASIFCCENGQEVLELLIKQEVDLILMDVQMPIMDGITCSKEIRKVYGKNIPIIALTANAITGEKEKCLEAEMNDFVSKPFEEDELLIKITRLINDSTLAHNKEDKNKMASHSNNYPIDISRLIAIGKGDKVFIKKMIDLFVQEVAGRSTDMIEALNKKDYKKISDLAHRLKPAMTDFRIVPDEIRQLELLAKEGVNTSQIEYLVHICLDALESAIAKIKQIEP